MVRKKVLILCTGNSCRSQMAEALINDRMRDEWEAFSAGTDPAGYTHPLAVQVLNEVGIVHLGRSKHTDEFRMMDLDLVLTVCDDAVENCPVWLGEGKRMHISFPDPAKASGSKEQVLEVFRAVRDDIEKRVLRYLRNFS